MAAPHRTVDTPIAAGGKPEGIGRRLLTALVWTLSGLFLAAVLVTAGAWWWAGSDGSLATTLRWVSQRQPLVAEGATGSLRAGGRVANLRWQQDGLDVQARGVAIAWQPWALLEGQLELSRAAAAEVIVNDQRPPDPNQPVGPPDSLRLPVRVQISDFDIGKLSLTGPTAYEAAALSGNYRFNGQQHSVELSNAELANGRYSGRATLSAGGPLVLEADITASLQADVPNGQAAVPITIQASASGPLTELLMRAAIQAAPPMAPGNRTPDPQPEANATVRIAPWAPQPLLEADADFRHLNVGAFFPDAPRTRLTGKASVRPDGTATSIASQAWLLQLQADNSLPGPWDRQRLPIDTITGTGEWRDGVALVRGLKATIGKGELLASGQWEKPASAAPGTTTPLAPPAAQNWTAEATLKNINPASLYGRLAAIPINGKASARSNGPAIAFDADLQAVAGRAPAAPTPSAGKARQAAPPALLLTLRQAAAKGSWNGERAGGTLTLSSLRVRTDDAELTGQLEVQPAAPGGKGNLNFIAPGIEASVQGELREASGGGELQLRGRDVAQALQWLKTLPGMPAAVQIASASGSGEVTGSWQGGWSDPALNARLDVPSLDWRVPTTKQASAVPPNADADLLKLRAVRATLTGRLSQAQLAAQGRIEQGARRIELQLAGSGGRSPVTSRGASLLNAPWQGSLSQLTVALEDAALGPGAWRLATRGAVPLRWTPDSSGSGQFESGAGQAMLTAPPERLRRKTPATTGATAASKGAPPQASIAWQPIRWRAGELVTAGKVTGLSMDWLELLAGPQLADAGVSGNLLLEGQWDARLGETVQLTASLGRVSGDLTMQAETAERTSARLPAGIRQARVSLTSRDEALSLAVQWDSDRAGVADGRFETRLSRADTGAAGAAGGWTWAPDAPVNGRLQAQLPRIGVWSVLAPPGWRLRGAVATDLTISGTRAVPQLAGTLQANNLALRSLADGIEFGNGMLRARLDGTRMRIDEFSLQGAGGNDAKGQGTGGQLSAKGDAGWINGRPEVRLDVRLDKLRPSLRTDRQATVSGDVQASLIGAQAELAGKLVVDQARIILPEEATPQLSNDVIVRTARGAAAGQKAPSQTSDSPASAVQAQGGYRAVKLALLVDLGPDFRVEGKGIETRLRGTLALSGESFSSPRLNGTISTTGGQYRAYGQRLDVERGLLRFTGAIDNPGLDILAIRPNTSQRVGLEILGTALLPRVRLYAQPELPDAEKLSWLIVGRASGSGGAEAALLQQAAIALLGSKTGGMSGGLAATFGLDELSFKGASSNAEGGATQAAVTLGKRFSTNFYAAYERSISGALGTLFVFYDLSQRFTVRAQAGQQSAVDLIYTVPYD